MCWRRSSLQPPCSYIIPIYLSSHRAYVRRFTRGPHPGLHRADAAHVFRRLLPRGPPRPGAAPRPHRIATHTTHRARSTYHTENRYEPRAREKARHSTALATHAGAGANRTAHASASAHGAWCGAHTPEPVATRVRATARNWYQVLAREPDPPRPRRPDPVYDLEVRTVGHPPRTTAHPATGGRIADPRVRHMYSLLTPWGTNTLARDRRRRGQFPFAPPFSRATATLSSVYEPRGRSQHACNGLFQRGVSIPRMRTACIG